MIEKRGTDRGSIISGRSTHNQRIERLQRDVFQGVLSYYYHLFYFLEDQNLLDPLNDEHVAALHHAYLSEINSKLQMWRKAWANHRMRTTRSSPLRLWMANVNQLPKCVCVGGGGVYAIRNRTNNIFTFHGANTRLIRVSCGN